MTATTTKTQEQEESTEKSLTTTTTIASSSNSPPSFLGLDTDKDAVRKLMWNRLVEQGLSIGPTHDVIPNFVGADTAAWHLSQTKAWQSARTIKCNPDPPQFSVRLRALYDNKVLYAPVPYLTKEFPYLRVDPVQLQKQGITFELAATSQGFVTHGERIGFDGVKEGHLDFCVVGSVAVSRQGARTGKGAGFADLETGIFRELGVIDQHSVMATSVHSCQITRAEDPPIVMRAHDSPLDLIATEQELIVTNTTQPNPKGVAWEQVREEQFESIPFLRQLCQHMNNSNTAT